MVASKHLILVVLMDEIKRREVTFSQSSDPQPNSLEAAIAAQLWRWAFLSTQQRLTIPDSEWRRLSCRIEFYLCGLLHQVELTRAAGTWCDGVAELSIERLHRRGFCMIGAAYAPHHMVPFELELHFAARRSLQVTRTVLRFGGSPSPMVPMQTRHPARIVADRPRRDRDWTVAVEFTPAEL